MPKKANPWMAHVAKVWKKQKGKMSYRETLKHAKLSYKKGAAAPAEAAPKKRRRKKKNVKFQEPPESEVGGAIRAPRKRSPKKKPKIDEAIKEKMKGTFWDPTHKYLHSKLSGTGGRLDSPYCREKMHQVMSRYHPALFQSYLSGRVRDIPTDPQYHPGAKPAPVRADPRPTVVDTGGSLRGLTHSENGLLQSFDSTFYSHLRLI